MIKFRKVTESDEQLNSQIEALNRKVFPSTETTANLHFLAGLYKGATVDFIAMEDDDYEECLRNQPWKINMMIFMMT